VIEIVIVLPSLEVWADTGIVLTSVDMYFMSGTILFCLPISIPDTQAFLIFYNVYETRQLLSQRLNVNAIDPQLVSTGSQ
jgi:hypothetical protein